MMRQGTVQLTLLTVTIVGIGITSCASPSSNRAENQPADRFAQVESNPTESNPTETSSTAPRPTDSSSDWVILPGERVGSVTTDTTFEDLVEQFGAEALTNEPFNVGEGELVPATHVELGEARSFTVLWQDESRTQATAVARLGAAWKTPEGIGMGTSLVELEETLGAFQLYGFGWDYSGTVILEGTPLAEYNDTLILRLSPEQAAVETQMEDYQAVMGDAAFSSTDPAMQALNPSVNQIIVNLAPSN